MACNIPYLRNANLSETERDRLENIHVEIFQQASDSKVFRRVDNRFQTIKKEYPKATEFVGKINSQFGKPVAKIVPIGNGNSVLSVNVLPLSTEQQQNLFLQKPNVDYQLKSADILASQKAIDWFKKRDKGQWKGDLFWQKLQQDLQIPKEQIELLKSLNVENPYNREEILTSLLANYSYTIEINTAKTPKVGEKFLDREYGYELEVTEETLQNQINDGFVDDNLNTQYYSNLTVPGGINYTEQEIATPAITPSIKGHAAFSTNSGIGWFRSDEQQLKDDLNTTERLLNEAINGDNKVYSELANVLKNHYNLHKSVVTRFVDFLKDFFGNILNGNFGNNIIELVKNLGKDNIRIFLHESIHGITSEKLAIYKGGDLSRLTQKEINAIKELERIFEKVKTELLNLKNSRGNNIFSKSVINSHYGFTNLDEFLAEAFTNREFQSLLSNIKGEGRKPNIFKQLLNAISDLLGLTDSTILEDIFALTEEFAENNNQNSETKTRRILEVQSDLFQKGRDKEQLSNQFKNLTSDRYLPNYVDTKNQFLQLLNKDNNWVTFFIKSIIQDSAKKGYEKVLFPSGDTASKIEGHATLEEFKKQKEDRIKKLEEIRKTDVNNKPWLVREINGNKKHYFNTEEDANEFRRINGRENFYSAVPTSSLKDSLKSVEDINNEINQLKQELERVEREGFGALKPIYNFYENTVTNILKKQGYNPTLITDEYGNTWNEIAITPEIKNQTILLQKKTPEIVASPQVIKLVKELIEKMGVKYEGGVNNIIVNGKKIDANGIANIMKGYIEVIDGKESEALPEEAMHFAVEIIEQKNPKLFNKMLSEINNFQIYSDVLRDYSNDPLYQTSDGKPDIRKLKKEAIAKQLVNTIINKMEGNPETYKNVAKAQSWWSQILEFIKNLFAKSGFDKAAMDIISGKEIGTIEDIRGQEGVFFQLNKQEKLINNLKETSAKIEKNENGYFIDGKRIPRVTETIKTWADKMFEDRKLTQSEYDKLVDQLKQEKGTAGHQDIEHAFSVFVDENGYLREEPLDDSSYVSQLNPENRDMYEILRDNLKQRLESYPAGTRFLSEITVYNPNRNLAGTIDFLAITPEGKVNILDWKFMALSDGYDDVPWYSVRSWNDQMTQYKLILEKAYNVDIKDFQQTRMIPILAKYSKGDKKKSILPRLLSVKIGDVNVKNIQEDYLLPVPLEGEKTGNKRIDSLLEKLNALYKQFSDKSVVPSKRLEKAEQLNALFTAIRQLQLKQNIEPLLYQAKILNKQIQDIIERYNNQWSNKEATKLSQKEISDFAEEIEAGLNAIQHYTTLDTELKFLFSGELSQEDKELRQELRDTVDNARDLNSELFDISKEFADKFIAGSEGIKGSILSPEKIIKGITKLFVSTSGLQMKSLEVLFKKVNRQLGYASQDTLNETKKLETFKTNYDQWASSKGLTNKNYFDLIKKKDKNELIDEYKSDFYKELKAKIAEKDYKWIRENVDVEKYKEYLSEKLKNEIQRIKDKPRVGTEQEIDLQITFETNKAKEQYSISTPTSIGWLLNTEIRKFPAEQWQTTEWKELHKKENKPALDFFNYIKERNEYYKEIGYINDRSARVFLPFVRKGLVEKAVLGGDIRFGEHFLRAISIDEGDIGYGKIDPLTGNLVNSIPKYFTQPIEGELSSDLFRTMALYNEAAIKFKYLSDIEAQARALINIEKNKKAILTSTFGKTVYKNGEIQYTPDNNENTKLLEDMVKAIVYGQRYIQSETFDQLIGKLGTFGKKINEKLGMKIFPDNIENRQVSVNKLLSQLNTTFQLNALGLNPLSALSNLLGGSFNSIINAGTYFTKSDFLAAEMNLTVNKFNGQDAKKMTGLIEYFLPFTDNYNQQLAKTLSLNKFSQENFQEFLMILMRKSDWFVQSANFFAYINNSIVQDGKVVNVREYLKSQPEFQEMYKGTKQERDDRKTRFEEEVKRLLSEKSVIKLSKVVDNQLVIEGVDRKDPSVIDVRRKVQFLNKSALGNLSEDDLRTINMNIYGKSFMLFKNWMPRLIDVRAGNLKYNSASDAYEWGRMRMIFRILAEDTIKSLDSLYNIYAGTDKGIARMRKLWEAKKADYEQDTGRTLEMTEDEFIELVRRNVRNQLKDSLIMLSLFGMFIGLGAIGPDDEEDENVKNIHRYLLRATDKVKDELWFFYDPTSLTSLVSSGIFPSISYINTLKKAIGNFGKEVYGLSIGDEELVDKNYVIKYAMKSFPITNQGTQILPLFYPELAKDLGLKVGTQSRPIGF